MKYGTLLVVVGEVDDCGHSSVGGGLAPLAEAVGGDGAAADEVVVGMGVDDAGQHNQAVGMHERHIVRDGMGVDVGGDLDNLRATHEDVRPPLPFRINQQSVLDQNAAHTPNDNPQGPFFKEKSANATDFPCSRTSPMVGFSPR